MPASGQIGENRRVALINRLNEVLGEEEAATLMASLPPVLWNHLATKDDVWANKAAIEANKAAIDANRAAIDANKAAIEASEQRLRSEMHAGFNNIRAEMHAGFKTLRAENTKFQGEMALHLAKQTRTIVLTLMGFAVTIGAALLAVGLS